MKRKLYHTRPPATGSNIQDSVRLYSVVPRYRGGGSYILTDHSYLSLSQFRVSIRLAFLSSNAALCNTVAHVIEVCTQKQMCRIYAGRVIATMENMQTQGNWAYGYNPRKTMREYLLTVNGKFSIAAFRPGITSPNQTTATPNRLPPKPLAGFRSCPILQAAETRTMLTIWMFSLILDRTMLASPKIIHEHIIT